MFDELNRHMNRLFQETDAGFWPLMSPMTSAEWPRINLYDAGGELLIQAQVPGLTESDIQITANQEVLTITGERKNTTPQGYSVRRQERGRITFSRSISFPCKVNTEKTSATVKDGILTIRLAKSPEAMPRQISITAN
jgi:HSP20 family protein